MQDGTALPAEEAGKWLREKEPEPKITLTWEVDPSPRPAQRARLLEILFGEDKAA
ncbi:hypothetical protein [Streptomyces sp. NPDC001843]|uniref:hypothetical protein n=1 Tax=Streptomyces sp. NPDC001843 TaxID=3364617 RepID=UPI003687F555